MDRTQWVLVFGGSLLFFVIVKLFLLLSHVLVAKLACAAPRGEKDCASADPPNKSRENIKKKRVSRGLSTTFWLGLLQKFEMSLQGDLDWDRVNAKYNPPYSCPDMCEPSSNLSCTGRMGVCPYLFSPHFPRLLSLILRCQCRRRRRRSRLQAPPQAPHYKEEPQL
jgi:hypothetical protein